MLARESFRRYAGLLLISYAVRATADPGDEFSNNLFSDLAPLLALFGERVTMQFMSQSMGWADSIILAIAPLGIITIVVGAIRIGGPPWLKAIIGRGRENLAVAEAELMSSTSREVCELWNGQQIVRVMGEGPTREFVILLPEQYHDLAQYHDGDGPNSKMAEVEVEVMELDHPDSSNHLKEKRRWKTQTRTLFEEDTEEYGGKEKSDTSCLIVVTRNTKVAMPNLALNVHNKVGRLELYIVAMVGITIQLGVLAWAVVATLYFQYEKDDEPIASYGLPCTVVGTVFLAAGILLCAYIVESGSRETYYRPGRKREGRVVWLQRSGTVNDQAFRPFAIFPEDSQPIVTTSYRVVQDPGQDSKVWRGAGPSRLRFNVTPRAVLTVMGTAISISGFAAQFTGLRAMYWSVSVAQLGAIITMTVLRALVRMNFVKSPNAVPLLQGYELDWLAMTLDRPKNAPWLAEHAIEDWYYKPFTWHEYCRPWADQGRKSPLNGLWDWKVAALTSPEFPKMISCNPRPESTRVDKVMRIRKHLGKLADWTGPAAMEAVSLTRAIEISMDALFGTRSKSSEFVWTLSVSETILHLRLLRVGGRSKAFSDEIESTLSLWLYSVHQQEEGRDNSENIPRRDDDDTWLRAKGTPEKPSLQVLGPNTPALYQDLRWWMPEGAARVISVDWLQQSRAGNEEASVVEAHRAVGFASDATISSSRGRKHIRYKRTSTRYTDPGNSFDLNDGVDSQGMRDENHWTLESPSNNDASQSSMAELAALAVESFTPLKKLYSQYMFSAFMWAAAARMSEPIRPSIDVRPELGDAATQEMEWDSITGQVSKLAQSIEATGLGSLDEIFLAIIPPLSTRNKLPAVSDAIVEWARLGAISHRRQANFEKASDLLIQLLTTVMNRTQVQMTVKATALVLDCCSTVSGIIKVRTQQQCEKNEVRSLLELQKRLVDELSKVHGGILKAIAGLYGTQQRPRDPQFVGPLDNFTDEHKKVVKYSMLHHSVHIGDLTLLEKEFEGGQLDMNAADVLDWTPAHYAVLNKSNFPLVLQHLRQQGALNFNKEDIRGRTPFHYACRFGNLSAMGHLRRDGVPFESEDHDGRTPMHLAAIYNQQPALQFLIQAGANIDVLDSSGVSPLHWATYRGHLGVMRALVSAKAKLDGRDQYGRTLLHLGVIADSNDDSRKEVVDFLLDTTAAKEDKDNLGRTPLHLAAQGGHEPIVKRLLEVGANTSVVDGSKYRATALHLAARKGKLGVVDLLLRSGANIEQCESRNMTPLHVAVSAGQEGVAGLLLGNGANVNAESEEGWTPLLTSLGHLGGKASMVKLLIEAGADVKATTDDKRGPLHFATSKGNVAIVELLLDKGADIDVRNSKDETPLQNAVRVGSLELVQLLLRRGAKIEGKDQSDQTLAGDQFTPLHWAAKQGHNVVVGLLLEKGADANAKTTDQSTPLHLAVEGGHRLVVWELLAKGADVNARDGKGRRPIERQDEEHPNQMRWIDRLM
ncbi:ankyrin repeat-containing domain protein [Triangularia verruculosa]|uniref:Ankyrin repeat-containing domain protein n=1 Tax=Triangularia verruculosa TaxID=2587418 RepID=A0AAN6XN95_9PEZI|nr:ankyrin repeat-containing domain protein [Triangularia verruculosa]